MLRILLGRANTGKSKRVLDEIRRNGKERMQILLVPEHASHVAEVDLCRACGDGDYTALVKGVRAEMRHCKHGRKQQR